MSGTMRRVAAARVVARVMAVGVVGLSPLLWAGVAHAALPPGCTGTATTGPDVITCSNGVPAGQTISSLGGNDKITVTGLVAGVIDAGAGDDTIIVNGNPANAAVDRNAVSGTVRGGAGNDTIAVNGGNGISNASSAGYAVAPNGLVHGGDGNDTLTLTGGNGDPGSGPGAHGVVGEVRGGAGADSITVRGGNGGTGSNGGDGVFGLPGIPDAAGAVHGGDPGLVTVLDAADGVDTINVTGGNGGGETSRSGNGGTAVGGVVSGGARGDIITLTGGNGGNNSGGGNAGGAGAGVEPNGVVAGGDPGVGLLTFEGGDTITVTGGNGGTSSSALFPDQPGGAALAGTLHGDRGDDRITLTGGNGSPTSAAGSAVVGPVLLPSDPILDRVEGGAGADTIALSLGEGKTDGVSAVDGAGIRGGGQLLGALLDGEDTITVGTAAHPDRGQSESARFDGDGGNDTITLYGTATNVTVNGGAGTDTCGKESTGAAFTCETVNP